MIRKILALTIAAAATLAGSVSYAATNGTSKSNGTRTPMEVLADEIAHCNTVAARITSQQDSTQEALERLSNSMEKTGSSGSDIADAVKEKRYLSLVSSSDSLASALEHTTKVIDALRTIEATIPEGASDFTVRETMAAFGVADVETFEGINCR